MRSAVRLQARLADVELRQRVDRLERRLDEAADLVVALSAALQDRGYVVGPDGDHRLAVSAPDGRLIHPTD